MVSRPTVWLAALILTLPATAQKKQEKLNAQHADAIAAAHTAADAWLAIEDSEDYGKSWEAASNYFHTQVPKEGWVRRMLAVRKPLDPVLTRDLSASEWKDAIPNLPKAEYVALAYTTVFVNGHSQQETVVMVHEGSGWKMVGYATE